MQCFFNILLSLEEDIDGNLLLNLRYEEIKSLFPKLKQRTLFMNERDKLSNNSASESRPSSSTPRCNNNSEENSLQIGETLTLSDSIPYGTEIVIESTEQSLCTSNSSNNQSENEENDNQLIRHEIKIREDYQLPDFPPDLKLVVNQNDIHKLGCHTHLRRVLLNLIYDDLANKHSLLYPTAQEYLNVMKAVLRALHISIDNKNALMFIARLDDQQDLHKLNQMLKDELGKSVLHMETILYMWRRTFSYRRLFTRNNLINEVLLEHPGYSLPSLILEEIRMDTDTDLERNVELLLPLLFEKLPDNAMFVSGKVIAIVCQIRCKAVLSFLYEDVLPVRVIKLLCNYFKDPVANIISDKDPVTPNPYIKILNDKYELYLDYERIVQTTSASEALSLLISLYNVFEIKFQRHGRAAHLLYGVLFEDTNELSKSLRAILLSWDYIIKNKSNFYQQHKQTTTMSTVSADPSALSIELVITDSNVVQQNESIQCHEAGDSNSEQPLAKHLSHTLEEYNAANIPVANFTHSTAVTNSAENSSTNETKKRKKTLKKYIMNEEVPRSSSRIQSKRLRVK
ncbi:unnamed protein product [Rotaria magnacalcarata]|uniref:Uncharacterized protein n=1 Tax=Rotaria magnacalcarata TaxID=392030 RepID=A0A816Q301_9BILA|nr:unnamed protein product [Rotaria magnacalcarata]